MGEPETKVYWILEGGSESLSFKDLRAEEILSPSELARWEAMRFEKRRSDFLSGRFTVKRLLTSPGMPWEGVANQSLEILNEEEGAPYLNTPDQQPSGSLSISHRAGLAAAAFCRETGGNVGIDLELIEQREWSFVDDFFTPTEISYVKGMPESVQPVLVTLIWSAKEAVLKAWRKGLRVDTRTIEIQPLGEDEVGSLDEEWVSIGVKVRDEAFPPCILYGRVMEEMVLTLAVTHALPSQSAAKLELIRV